MIDPYIWKSEVLKRGRVVAGRTDPSGATINAPAPPFIQTWVLGVMIDWHIINEEPPIDP